MVDHKESADEAKNAKRLDMPRVPRFTEAARFGSLPLLIAACKDAGWALKVNYLGPDSVYDHRVELRLTGYQESDDGGPDWVPQPTGTLEPDRQSAVWYWQGRHQINATGCTLSDALDALIVGVSDWADRRHRVR